MENHEMTGRRSRTGCRDRTMEGVGTRLLIVDDHAGFRRLARRVLELGGYEVVGEVADGLGVLAAVGALRPDLVLLDIALPDLDGFAVAEQLAALPEPPAVVLVSSRPGSDFGMRIDRAPVRGFLAKEDLSAPTLAAAAARPR
jgi:DNA-binding NarL/FixJ family response regulator